MRKDGILQVVKATLAALIFSLVFVIIFTLIIQLASVKASVIKPVNQVFKIIAVAVGGLLFIRGEKGFLKGAIAGLASVLLSYVLFGIIGGSFAVNWTFALEIVLGSAAGIITGIIAVNVKKS
ncbi:MAG: TIGR04086 family membrane protein [Clostridia bacterium]|nr:TIGR04086 family membrane protein [Clostridia bacterium]